MPNFAGSVGQLGAQDMAISQQQRASLERTLQGLLARHEQQRQGARQDKQLSLQESAAGEQQRQFNVQAQDVRLQRYADMLERQNDRLLREKFESNRLELEREKLDVEKKRVNPTEFRAQEMSFKTALNMAGEGTFESAADVLAKFPKLAPEEAALVAQASVTARRSIEGEAGRINNAATVLNTAPGQRGRLANMMAAERERSWNPANNSMILSNKPDEEAISEWGAESEKLRGAEAAIDTATRSNMTYDPEAGQYKSTFTLPWARKSVTNPGTTTSTAGPKVDPQIAIAEAKAAIAKGKDPTAVINRLREMGIEADF